MGLTDFDFLPIMETAGFQKWRFKSKFRGHAIGGWKGTI